MPSTLGQIFSSLTWNYDQISCTLIMGQRNQTKGYVEESYIWVDPQTIYNIAREYQSTLIIDQVNQKGETLQFAILSLVFQVYQEGVALQWPFKLRKFFLQVGKRRKDQMNVMASCGCSISLLEHINSSCNYFMRNILCYHLQ